MIDRIISFVEQHRMLQQGDCVTVGLSGGADSAARRRALQQELGLPEHLGSAGLLQALNLLMTREEFQHRYGELR